MRTKFGGGAAQCVSSSGLESLNNKIWELIGCMTATFVFIARIFVCLTYFIEVTFFCWGEKPLKLGKRNWLQMENRKIVWYGCNKSDQFKKKRKITVNTTKWFTLIKLRATRPKHSCQVIQWEKTKQNRTEAWF